MISFISKIGIYARTANGIGTLTLGYSPDPQTAKVGSVTIDVDANWQWRWADINTFWDYDSLFIWVESVNGPVFYGYDTNSPDAYKSADSGRTWTFESRRYFVRVMSEPMIMRPQGGQDENAYWILSRDSKESRSSHLSSEAQELRLKAGLTPGDNPVPLIFTSMPDRYVYGVEITFADTRFATKSVETIIYVDDFGLDLYGTSFGLLGTDHQGRDLFAQLIYGTRISLYLGILVAVMSVSIGLVVGLAAGYLGKFADELLMRFNDLLLVLPGLPLLIVLVAVLGASIENLIILMGFLGWNGFARLVRSQVLSLKERPFVEAAKSVGAGTGHIIWRHILPNVMSLVYITLATSVPGAVTAEAALSWLGFYDPNRMSWGRMLFGVFEGGAVRNWWWVIMPGLMISLLAVSFILLGFALDDILNPKLRVRK